MENTTIKYLFPMQHPVQWGDMDALNHVNNCIFIRYFETVRVHFMMQTNLWKDFEEAGLQIVVGRMECNYRKPIYYPDLLTLSCGIQSIGNSSMVIHQQIECKDGIAGEGIAVIVCTDIKTGAKTAIPANLRAKLESWM